MSKQTNRRKFIKKSVATSLTGCALLIAAKYNPLGAFNYLAIADEIPDPSKLNYCGYTCSADCKLLKASEENNVELKKEAFTEWKIKEKHGVEFNADEIFCWGCKNTNKPAGIVVRKCTVRKCAIEKGYDACIECDELNKCNKELWKSFPDFHKSVIKMQENYNASIK